MIEEREVIAGVRGMSDVIYIPELARMLGISDAAVRGHIQRRTDAIPPWFHLGRRVAWRRADVQRWLEEKASTEIAERPTRRARSSARDRAPYHQNIDQGPC